MLFNSIEFLVFFPVVVALYFAIPFRFRWMLLLAASYVFYMSWKVEYGILMFLSTLVDYFVARQMEVAQGRKRNAYLVASLFSNLGVLFTFKYFNFFSNSVSYIVTRFGAEYTLPHHELLLPVGISFYTFQALNYTIDVYLGQRQAERHFGKFALYIAFFPHLVAGPIVRSEHLLPQFSQRHYIDYDRITSGLRLMAWGFFKKVVIADRIAPIVNAVYNNPTNFSGTPLIVATYLFAIQIYCDFSGYSDIAIGAARVMGYDLTINFRQPYFARSVTEFWRRWHISLSTWFRDYVYKPLGGNRVAKWRWYFNLFVVFLVSGLWHGANWTFVIWGALHGAYVVLDVATSPMRSRLVQILRLEKVPILLNAIQIFVTAHLVIFAWVFFRANSVTDAFYILRNLVADLELRSGYGVNAGGAYGLAILGLSVVVLLAVDWMQLRGSVSEWFSRRPVAVRWALYYAGVFGILIFGKLGSTEFIYFQF